MSAGAAEPAGAVWLPAPAGPRFPVPAGKRGGKDSAVTLELLRGAGVPIHAYIINPRGATIHTTEAAGLKEGQVLNARRTLDPNMLELNRQGYLNGHTPFSALVAFSSIIAARMHGLSQVALSNESSANESTVQGSTVNHHAAPIERVPDSPVLCKAETVPSDFPKLQCGQQDGQLVRTLPQVSVCIPDTLPVPILTGGAGHIRTGYAAG